jgi:hypothetical protein
LQVIERNLRYLCRIVKKPKKKKKEKEKKTGYINIPQSLNFSKNNSHSQMWRIYIYTEKSKGGGAI